MSQNGAQDTVRRSEGILSQKILRPSQCITMCHLFKLGDLTKPPNPPAKTKKI